MAWEILLSNMPVLLVSKILFFCTSFCPILDRAISSYSSTFHQTPANCASFIQDIWLYS